MAGPANPGRMAGNGASLAALSRSGAAHANARRSAWQAPKSPTRDQFEQQLPQRWGLPGDLTELARCPAYCPPLKKSSTSQG
jgi:hypothetical protein